LVYLFRQQTDQSKKSKRIKVSRERNDFSITHQPTHTHTDSPEQHKKHIHIH